MQLIQAILFEPVGCLAEFPSAPFLEIASHTFGRPKKPSKSASRAYWHLLNLAEAENKRLDNSAAVLEMEAVNGASVYEDVAPALAELKRLGIQLIVASSLSSAAIGRFLDLFALAHFFSAAWSRDTAGGIKAEPLRAAIAGGNLNPQQTMFLADTAEGLKTAKSVAVNAILMMNDPDEAKRLALEEPAGGIVSLHELPDFVRLVAAHNPRQPSS